MSINQAIQLLCAERDHRRLRVHEIREELEKVMREASMREETLPFILSELGGRLEYAEKELEGFMSEISCLHV